MELFLLLGTVLSAVIGAISNGITNKQNMENANEQLANQQEFSHNEAILANDRALENYWETQSPQSRVQQYKDAGLSVGLMYGGQGNGGVNSSPQASTPGANLPIMSPILRNGLNDVFENIKKISETENITEDTEKKKQEVQNMKNVIEVNNATIEKIAKENNLTEVLTQNSILDGTLKEIEIQVQNSTKEDRIKIVATQLKNMQNEGEKQLKEIQALTIDNENKQKMYDATLKKMYADTCLVWKEVIKTEAETFLYNAQRAYIGEQSKMSYVERMKTWKEIENYKNIMAQIEAQTELIQAQTEMVNTEKVNVKMDRVTKVIGWMEQIGNIQNGINSRFNNTIKTLGY